SNADLQAARELIFNSQLGPADRQRRTPCQVRPTDGLPYRPSLNPLTRFAETAFNYHNLPNGRTAVLLGAWRKPKPLPLPNEHDAVHTLMPRPVATSTGFQSPFPPMETSTGPSVASHRS